MASMRTKRDVSVALNSLAFGAAVSAITVIVLQVSEGATISTLTLALAIGVPLALVALAGIIYPYTWTERRGQR